jgi:hypothetical protein
LKLRAKDMHEEWEKKSNKISRRDFARTAVVAAAATAMPATIAPTRRRDDTGMENISRGSDTHDASAARQAEIDARVGEVYRRYGDRLSAEQKAEVRRLAGELQKALDKLRAYPLGNGNQPATVLRLVPAATEAHRAPRS